MKKISMGLILAMFVMVLSGCSVTINGKKVLSLNEDKKIDWSSGDGKFSWPSGNNVGEKTEVLEQEVDTQERITVSNSTGKIVFKSWDNDKVQVTAHKRVKAGGDKEKLDKLLDEIKINIEKSSNNIEVNVRYISGVFGFGNQNVELEVMVPKKLNSIKANSASGEIQVSDFTDMERLDLTSVSGSVEVRNAAAEDFDVGATSGEINLISVTGNGNIHTVSGSIQANDVKGDLKFRTTSGSVNAEGIEGEASASTVSGSVNIVSNYLKGSEFNSTSGSLYIQAEKIDDGGDYKIRSISGEVCMKLPENAGFELDASSTSGEIRNEFSMTVDGGNGRKNLRGTVGNGGPDIKINTVSGEISIMK